MAKDRIWYRIDPLKEAEYAEKEIRDIVEKKTREQVAQEAGRNWEDFMVDQIAELEKGMTDAGSVPAATWSDRQMALLDEFDRLEGEILDLGQSNLTIAPMGPYEAGAVNFSTSRATRGKSPFDDHRTIRQDVRHKCLAQWSFQELLEELEERVAEREKKMNIATIDNAKRTE